MVTYLHVSRLRNRKYQIAVTLSSDADSSNNEASANLTLIRDESAPQLVAIAPADGAFVQEPTSRSFTIFDAYSAIDDESVMRHPATTDITGYTLYRAAEEFTNPADAELLNPETLLNGTSYSDLPAQGGVFVYRLLTVSQADNESELSEALFALSDRTPPTAAIGYAPHPDPLPEGEGTDAPHPDPLPEGEGIFAPGTVEIALTLSEPLQSAPFLSLTPHNGFPISPELSKVSDLEYRARVEIDESTPSGTAYVIFSARDLTGNRGTEMLSGATLEIDIDGPTLTRIELHPDTPIQQGAAAPVSVTVTIGLDEAMPSGASPSLAAQLSGPNREAFVIEGLTEILPPEGDDLQSWQATFSLPAETLSFLYEGIDDLDNSSTRITAENSFQIYQGDLPPLDAPDELSAEALSDGTIQRSWQTVDDPSGSTSFGYDSWGNLHSLTDAAGQTTQFSYDNAGKLLHEIRPLGGQSSFSYDAQGRLESITTPKPRAPATATATTPRAAWRPSTTPTAAASR